LGGRMLSGRTVAGPLVLVLVRLTEDYVWRA
jgi:hypothetical protein